MKKIRIISLMWFITLLAACNQADDSPYPDIVFTKKTGMPEGGRANAVSFVIDNKAYVTLGRNALYGSALKDCWEYNAHTDTWSKKADFPGTARVNAIAETVNGMGYAGLGYDPEKGVYTEGSILTDFWMYNPQRDTWTRKPDFPPRTDGRPPAVNSCFSFVYENCIYVGANFNAYQFSTDFWKYDTTNDKWIKLKDMPQRATAAVACTNGKLFYSGTGYETVNKNSWWEYFPEQDKWRERKSMPDNGRLNAVAFSINDRFFVATGLHIAGSLTGGHLKSDIMEYDATNNRWYQRGNVPDGGRENAIAFVIDDTAYIGLGESTTTILNDLWSFKP